MCAACVKSSISFYRLRVLSAGPNQEKSMKVAGAKTDPVVYTAGPIIVTCARCNGVTELPADTMPEDAIKHLTLNRDLKDLVDSNKQGGNLLLKFLMRFSDVTVKICISCKQPATSLCETCTKISPTPVLLCDSCWPKVHSLPWNADHAKQSPSASRKSSIILIFRLIKHFSELCPKHHDELKLFCITDNALACATCAFSSTHKVPSTIAYAKLKCRAMKL